MEMLYKAIVLGIVEGITEFLPVSSTGHLIICNKFINFSGNFAVMFDVVIQLGAILSVVIFFWNRLFPFGKNTSAESRNTIINTWKKTIVGVLPALALGGAFGGVVEEHLFNPLTVAVMLFVGGIALIIIESRRSAGTISSIDRIPYRIILAIGLFQCIAMIPGTSRSAATIIGAMLLGVSRVAAAEFSFFLAIPTMAAASAYSIMKTGAHLSGAEWITLAVGFFVSFLTAWGVIALFMRYIKTHDFKPFGYYRIVLGVVIIVLIRFLW